MAALIALVCFAVSLAALAFAIGGVRLWLADRQLAGRLVSGTDTAISTGAGGWHLPALFEPRGRDRAEIDEKLRQAGFYHARAIERFGQLRLGASLAVALLTAIATGGLSGRWGANWPFYAVGTFVAAFLAWISAKLVLSILAGRRGAQLLAEFPFLIDLMLMMLQSGVSLDQCFRSIARDELTTVPHLGRQVALLVADCDRGMNYETALERWAERIGVTGARELASLFRQALFQGIELAPAMREFAGDFTQRRISTAREAMGKITVRMVILMLIFFMPALFIVLGGPAFITILDTLNGMHRP